MGDDDVRCVYDAQGERTICEDAASEDAQRGATHEGAEAVMTPRRIMCSIHVIMYSKLMMTHAETILCRDCISLDPMKRRDDTIDIFI